jgi:hypothetical protein
VKSSWPRFLGLGVRTYLSHCGIAMADSITRPGLPAVHRPSSGSAGTLLEWLCELLRVYVNHVLVCQGCRALAQWAIGKQRQASHRAQMLVVPQLAVLARKRMPPLQAAAWARRTRETRLFRLPTTAPPMQS